MSSSLILLFYGFSYNMNHFLIGLWCVKKKVILYDKWQPAQWLDQEEAP